MPEVPTMNHMPMLKGWRAEVGMLAPLSWMYREYDEVDLEGVKFSLALLGHEAHTAEALRD